MQKRVIKTNLMGREEIFKALVLAEVTKLPILLEGPPGTGKTKAITDYGIAALGGDPDAMTGKEFFIIETDEHTRSSEVKGRPDMEQLAVNNKFIIDAPIAEASYVLVNEIDKASSTIRNALLGIMNEKFVFNGSHKIQCDWKLFAGACNLIPESEVGNPFWDRFVFKIKLERMPIETIMDYYKAKGKNFSQDIEVNFPTDEDIEKVLIPGSKLGIFLHNIHSKCSDRTLTFIPKIIASISLIYNCSITEAMVTTAKLLISPEFASQISNKISSASVNNLYKQIKVTEACKTDLQFLEECKNFINALDKTKLEEEERQELLFMFNQMVASSFVGNKLEITDEMVQDLISNKDWDKSLLKNAEKQIKIS